MKLNRQKIRAIVFDFDGVVVDSEPLYEKAEARLFAEYGVTIPESDWRLLKGLSDRDFFALCKERYGIHEELSILQRKGKRLLEEEFLHNLHYIDGFEDFVREIRPSFLTGLVTSTKRTFLEWIFQNTPIHNHFEMMITAENVASQKPQPEPYLKMAELMQIRPEEMIVLEDSINGVKSAMSAGALTIAFLSSFPKEMFEAADFFAATYTEVREIVLSVTSCNKLFSCI
jgi:HAD superfamily hydrolase (TIGR01509 family)